MYKVIIVDDEPMIREGLKALISWDEYGFEVVETASNGKEGYEKFKALQPELMIIDIRMPEMDGLYLIRKIREENQQTHFLILSGYADFQYAQKAIDLHADGYLLKPLDEEELIEYLQTIVEKIEKERMMLRAWEDERKKVRNEFVRVLLLGGHSYSDSKIEQLCKEFHLSYPSYQVALIAGIINDRGDQAPIVQLIEGSDRGLVIPYKEWAVVLLFEGLKSYQSEICFYEQVKEVVGDSKIYVAIGEAVYDIKQIAQSFQTAYRFIQKSFYFREGLLTSRSCSSTTAHLLRSSYSAREYSEKLFYALEIGDLYTCKTILQEIGHHMIHFDYDEQQIKNDFVKIMAKVLNKFDHTNPTVKPKLETYFSEITAIYSLRNLPDIQDYMAELCKKIIEIVCDGKSNSNMKRIIDFVDKHYNENLRLENLAELFHYNSAYLGKLFKNYTGEYFNTYLDKVRIHHAKRLLLEGYKVYEVAEQVGYANVDYFHKKFRKYTGMSPAQFRKSHASVSTW
ncbi:response regulator transcription factor [Geobacillus sp. PK12]|uniref:Uncharacterized protein n=1 Tax=Geobacillus thermodenitrificans TaxID=33940 RepID=A0A291I5S1_GEOTD|nr:response regulator transcription factor [Geobacillus sp. PK12]ATG84597.1 hypothetical protein [Geobacillus thermodenitrificans]